MPLGEKTSTILTQYLKDTKDSSSDNNTLGKQKIRHYYQVLLSKANNLIVEKTKYATSKASQRSYLLPPDLIKINTVRQYEGSKWHRLNEIKTLGEWQDLTYADYTSNVLADFFMFNQSGNKHLEIDPLPAANGSSNDIEIVFDGYQDPLLFPTDYTTGTIVATNGSPAIVGTSTVFTSAMEGRFLSISDGKYWYEIDSVTDDTHLTLVQNFQEGTGSTTYEIAEVMRLPLEFHYIPAYGAAADYFQNKNEKLFGTFKALYLAGEKEVQDKYKNRTKGQVQAGKKVGAVNSNVPRNYPTSALTRS